MSSYSGARKDLQWFWIPEDVSVIYFLQIFSGVAIRQIKQTFEGSF